MECDLAKQVIQQEPPLSRFPSHLKALFTCLYFPLSFFLPSSFPLGICIRLMIQFNGISLKELTFVYILLVEDGRCNGNKKPMAPPRSKVQGGPVVSVSPPTLQSG